MNILFIGNGFDIEHNINIHFKDFIIWCRNKLKSYEKYFQDEEYRKFSKDSSLWSDFEAYLKSVVKENSNIKHQYFILTISGLLETWLSSVIKIKYFNPPPLPKNKIVKLIKKNSIQTIISFNYTETPKIYKFNKLTFSSKSFRREYQNMNFWKGKYVKLHHFESKSENCILGHDESNSIEKEKFIKHWSDGNDFNPKKQVLQTIINHENVKKLVFFGFSFGKSDLRIIEFVEEFIKKYKNREVIIYYFKNMEVIQNKFKKSAIKHSKIEWIDWNAIS